MSGIGLVVLRRHPPCSVLKQVRFQDRQVCPLRNRFQELVSDDECEDETDLQQQLPCCSATTTHDEKKILKVIPGVDVPMTPSRSFVNPLIAEPVDMDIHPLVSDRWCRTDTRSGWRKITTVMDSGASDSCAPPSLAPEVEIRESVGSRTGQKYKAPKWQELFQPRGKNAFTW